MTRFKVTRPNQDVRLKKWAPGRVSQLKLFLSHLERAVNNSLAAQVEQSSSRKFSEFVPKIPSQNVEGQIEYRELRVAIVPPRGLKDFLFYEYQISETQAFFQFDGFNSPETSFVFTDLEDSSSYFFRVRVVTKSGFVGPWSDVFQADMPDAKAQGTFDETETHTVSLTSNSFTDILERDYTAIGGKTYYSVEYEMIAKSAAPSRIYWADIEFRWEVDGNQVGQDMLVTVYASSDVDLEAITSGSGANWNLSIPGNMLTIPSSFDIIRRGSLIQKFSTLEEGDRTIKLRAKIRSSDSHPTPNDYQFSAGTVIDYTQGAEIRLKNFNIFEATVEI